MDFMKTNIGEMVEISRCLTYIYLGVYIDEHTQLTHTHTHKVSTY